MLNYFHFFARIEQPADFYRVHGLLTHPVDRSAGGKSIRSAMVYISDITFLSHHGA